MAGKVSSDPNVFLLPDIGEGLQEAELIRWLVKEGDTVEEQQSLAEVETDKALTEIPSPRAGTIKTLHGKDGDTMKVGEPFVTFVAEGESASTPAASPDRPAGQQPQPEAAQRQDEGTVVGKMSDQVPGLTRVQGKALATPAVRRKAREMGIDINQVPGTGIGGRVLEKDLLAFAASGGAAKGQASPSTDADARQPAAGTRRAEPAGTTRRPLGGPRPPVRGGATPSGQAAGAPPAWGQSQATAAPQPAASPWMQQVPAGAMPMGMMPMGMPMMLVPVPMMMPGFGWPQAGFAGAGQGAVPAAPGFVASGWRAVPDPAQPSRAVEGDAQTPFRGVRRTIAQRLRTSVDTAVHFTVMDEADVTDLDAMRRQLAQQGTRLSFLPFVAAAVCRAIGPRAGGRFGALNARVEGTGDDQEIIEYHAVHLGIATDTSAGLMVPVVRDADALDPLGLGEAIARVAQAARDRTASRDELAGSTFTISNVGSHAGRFATPVINAPEVAILAVGKVYDGVVVRDGQAMVGKKMPLSLACDHRVVDGATAALALAEIVGLLQQPQAIA